MLLKFRRVGKAYRAPVVCSLSWLQSEEEAEPIFNFLIPSASGEGVPGEMLGPAIRVAQCKV